MLCPKCAYPNAPIEMACGRCGNILKTKAEVEEKRREWAGFPPDIKKEFEEKYKKAQSRYREYELFLKNNRVKHIIFGIIISVILGFISYLPKTSGVSFFIYLALGAGFGGVSGFWLNRKGGGAFRGAILTWCSFMIPSILLALQESVGISSYQQGAASFGSFVFPAFVGTASAVGIGYFFGLKLDFDRGEKSI